MLPPPLVLRQATAWIAVSSACLAPFLFGAVERSVWIPLCCAWLGLGLVAYSTPLATTAGDVGRRMSKAVLPLHVLFALQLFPLPSGLLGVLSPGSFAAHFLPDPGNGQFQPVSVSPGATLEAWLYIAGLQGLFVMVQGLSAARRGLAIHIILAAGVVLAVEGLWQSRSAHPYFLYGRIPTFSPQGLETSTFGPYFNRNHFASVTAMACGIAAGLGASLTTQSGGFRRLIGSSGALPRAILLVASAGFLVLASAASGSRSGTLAALTAIAVVSLRTFGSRVFLAVAILASGAIAVVGPSSMERLARLDLVASRWLPWLDMTTLFRFFPWFGAGIGAFGTAYWPYQMNATYEFWPHAHNEYLEWTIEGGLAGVLTGFLVARSLRRSLQFSAPWKAAAIGAIAAFAAQSVLDFPFRIPANSALLACLLAVTTEPRVPRG